MLIFWRDRGDPHNVAYSFTYPTCVTDRLVILPGNRIGKSGNSFDPTMWQMNLSHQPQVGYKTPS